MKRDSSHPSQHDKFSLGKVDDAGGIVDYVKSNSDYGVNTTIGNTGKKILKKEFLGHIDFIRTGCKVGMR